MAETNIKSEPRSRAATESESESVADNIKQDPSTLQVEGSRLWSVAPETLDTTALAWRHCTHLNHSQQIEIKEQAARDASVCLRDIEAVLKTNLPQVPSSQRWLQRIDTIRENKRDCKVLIGLIGASGAGKSSLINALLEFEDLLPADDEKACTAVCVEIGYNHSKDPSQIFLARVERITEDDLRVELVTLFKDVTDQAQNKDGDDGEIDLHRNERIKTAFQKLKCVYPYIDSPKDLKNYSVKSLLSHPNVKDILGKKEFISETTLKGFATKIKPFIDNSSSKEDGGELFSQWPLVKVVHLLVKSEVLKNGIVLVDLPGNMDTNLARGAIADAYQQRLKITCVVAPISRAATDKPAQDLLGNVRQRTLKLDNRFSTDSLCFIVSKTDASLSTQRYISTHSNVEESLSDAMEREEKYNAMLNRAKEYCAEKRRTQASNKAALDKFLEEYKCMPGIAQKSGVARPRKRKRGDEDKLIVPTQPLTKEEEEGERKRNALKMKIKQAQKKYSTAGSELSRGQEKIGQLDDAIKVQQSHQKAVCIRNRNEVSAKELRKDYENASKQMGQENQKPLQVFCVSAHAFAAMAKGSTGVEGFLKLDDTGLPLLQSWLNETTLEGRERNAVAFLEDILSLQLSITPWIANTSAEFKMTQTQRQAVEVVFDKHFGLMLQSISEINSAIVQECVKLVKTGLFAKMPKYESIAADDIERTVKGWAQKPMHWSTHRAVNRNNGEYKPVKGELINWNEDLAGIYLEPFITRWAPVIHNELPKKRGTYDSKISNLIENFVENITTQILAVCPEMTDAFGNWKESILRIPTQVQKHSFKVFNDKIQGTAREAHRTVKPKIQDGWAPVYEKCGEEHGVGHFKRNQTAHIEHARQNPRKMYKQGSKAIRAAFQKLWDELRSEFGKGTTPASAQVKDEFQTMITNHTPSEETTDAEQCAAKARLQQEIQASFDKVKANWAKRIELPKEEKEVDPKLEDVDIEDLLNPENDFIYVTSSSEDDDDDPDAR
ncbi:Nuclear GTPase SLIP-GC [Lachnellula cervina]|uniref:Nuclear GTPase SLIP-GC n=1 Tax=Lachnellula cervina TaxID=1316786 RepID=A0A7D8UJE7_9HELO|nr:Nuclear GTPase SLIP-GC [Lachnellula cervina]